MKTLGAIAIVFVLVAGSCGYHHPHGRRAEFQRARDDFRRAGWEAREELRQAQRELKREMRNAREEFRREMRRAHRDFREEFGRW